MSAVRGRRALWKARHGEVEGSAPDFAKNYPEHIAWSLGSDV
jgi:hypothetical protein